MTLNSASCSRSLAGLSRDHDEREIDPRERLRNLEPETARLVALLARLGGRKRMLEIGTSNGYSTLWLAWAARETGGRLTSVDRDAGRQGMAAENLRRAGLRDVVNLILGDASEVVASLPGPFDLVFFDADRVSAPAQWASLRPKLAPGALVLSDNVLSHPAEIAGYLATIEELLSSSPTADGRRSARASASLYVAQAESEPPTL